LLIEQRHIILKYFQHPSQIVIYFGRVFVYILLGLQGIINILIAQPNAPYTPNPILEAHAAIAQHQYFGQISPASTLDSSSTNKAINEAPYLIIDSIFLSGNKRTKDRIILRELDFKVGDTLKTEQMEDILKKNRNQVYNTGLFNDVTIKIAKWQNRVGSIVINMEERWYIFPVPIFQLTDRNLNDWWVNHNHDLRRTEYGFQFIHSNFRGRREKLKLLLQTGYTQKYELAYQIPFLDRKGKTGLSIVANYINNREIALQTVQNKQVFYRDSTQAIRTRFRTGMTISHRPDIAQTHHFSLNYIINTIQDTIAQMNPDYFLDGRTRQAFVHLSYNYVADHRDIRAYPLNGYNFRLSLNKMGLSANHDINTLSLLLSYSYYFPVYKKWYALLNMQGRVSFPERQPYYNQQGLGYGSSTLRGYDYYVIDGQHFAICRTALKYELLKTKFTNPFLKGDQFKTLPLAIYLKTYAETGYVQDNYYTKNNHMANKWLVSGGVGIDIFTVYDAAISLEYTWNAQREGNFFISFRTGYD
jgi:outer membrane protein assembly factor BamA